MKLKGNLYHNIQIIFAYNTNHIEGSKLMEDQKRYIFETNTILFEGDTVASVDYILDIAEEDLIEEIMKKFHICQKDKFEELWNKISSSIVKNGYFVGNFLGVNDEWKSTRKEMTFLTKDQVKEVFKEFEIIDFKEVEKDALPGLGKIKHWHIFNIIAKKCHE